MVALVENGMGVVVRCVEEMVSGGEGWAIGGLAMTSSKHAYPSGRGLPSI